MRLKWATACQYNKCCVFFVRRASLDLNLALYCFCHPQHLCGFPDCISLMKTPVWSKSFTLSSPPFFSFFYSFFSHKPRWDTDKWQIKGGTLNKKKQKESGCLTGPEGSLNGFMSRRFMWIIHKHLQEILNLCDWVFRLERAPKTEDVAVGLWFQVPMRLLNTVQGPVLAGIYNRR